jgi:hypothetical protein
LRLVRRWLGSVGRTDSANDHRQGEENESPSCEPAFHDYERK